MSREGGLVWRSRIRGRRHRSRARDRARVQRAPRGGWRQRCAPRHRWEAQCRGRRRHLQERRQGSRDHGGRPRLRVVQGSGGPGRQVIRRAHRDREQRRHAQRRADHALQLRDIPDSEGIVLSPATKSAWYGCKAALPTSREQGREHRPHRLDHDFAACRHRAYVAARPRSSLQPASARELGGDNSASPWLPGDHASEGTRLPRRSRCARRL